ncbi:class F sortase [Paractinoplanes rishiriensis]|uniref:class F sortase n=1 Tax=Paractinoplanes rishiriensis TaxID=1050105 RepID=UPI001EF1EE6E|nr:class F sortase [Actinoplanes rishiriensis]
MSVRLGGGALRGNPGRVLALVVGLVLVGGFLIRSCRDEPAADFGRAAIPLPSVSPEAATPVGSGQSAPPPRTPNRIRIPKLRLDAAVDAVGIDTKTGDFAVPRKVDRVGWYRYGPGFEATAGSIVLAGHVDSAAEGRGAFFRLRDLAAGDLITLADGRGERTFEVTARKTYRKAAIPLERYFVRDGAPRLTLITCGGPFDEDTRHYRDNVVVTAVPRG